MTERRALLLGGLGTIAAGAAAQPARAAAMAPESDRVRRTTVAIDRPFAAVARQFEALVGRWDMADGQRLVQAKAPWHEVEQDVARAGGPRGLMIFARIDQGEIISLAGPPLACTLYLVGNPVIANDIIRIDIRASFLVPFRVGLYGREAGGTAMTYDRPSSFLAALGHPELAKIGRLLDEKIDGVAAELRRG